MLASASFTGAPIAQSDRALDFESRGWEFESLWARSSNGETAGVWMARFTGAAG